MNKGWMTKEKIQQRFEDAMGEHAAWLDMNDWKHIVKEAQWLVREGYSRGFSAGKLKMKRQERVIKVKVINCKGRMLA